MPQKVFLLLSEAFQPTESRRICRRGLSKGDLPALCFACRPGVDGSGS